MKKAILALSLISAAGLVGAKGYDGDRIPDAMLIKNIKKICYPNDNTDIQYFGRKIIDLRQSWVFFRGGSKSNISRGLLVRTDKYLWILECYRYRDMVEG